MRMKPKEKIKINVRKDFLLVLLRSPNDTFDAAIKLRQISRNKVSPKKQNASNAPNDDDILLRDFAKPDEHIVNNFGKFLCKSSGICCYVLHGSPISQSLFIVEV